VYNKQSLLKERNEVICDDERFFELSSKRVTESWLFVVSGMWDVVFGSISKLWKLKDRELFVFYTK